MAPCSPLEVKVGHGVCGDINAHAMSPRQILVVRQEDLEVFDIAPGALRENVVIAGLAPDAFQPGALVRIGEAVTIRLTFLCEACKRIAHVVPSLKSIADTRGLMGVILSDGLLHIGDSVASRPHQFAPLSDIPYRRFLAFVAKIPEGKVVTYRQVVIGMGVAESYMRAIPMYIQRSSATEYPLHRILDTAGQVIPYVKDQQQLLEAEKLPLLTANSWVEDSSRACVSPDLLPQYLWYDPTVYLA